jgi:hypothetical protein
MPSGFPWAQAITLLVISSVVAALATVLDPISSSGLINSASGTTTYSKRSPVHAILGSLITPLHTTIIFVLLACVGVSPMTCLKLGLLFAMAATGEYVLLLTAMAGVSSSGFDSPKLDIYETLPHSVNPTADDKQSLDKEGPDDITLTLGFQSQRSRSPSRAEDDSDEATEDVAAGRGMRRAITLLSILPLVFWLGGEVQGFITTLSTIQNSNGVVRGPRWARHVDVDL